MSVPLLVVTGFLGAGKTSFINGLLENAGGRRIAAIVNDFGAINIDASLIETRTQAVIGLSNGCVCCSLQGDLLRTIKTILSAPRPVDHIVIEASGVADPAGIVEAVMDPVLKGSVRLNAILSLLDAQDLMENPARKEDPLWRAQIAAADFLAVNRLEERGRSEVLAALKETCAAAVFDIDREQLPVELFLDSDAGERTAPERLSPLATDRFATLEMGGAIPLPLESFQLSIQRLSPGLLRAKGILNFAEQPSVSMLFQLVGRRATLEKFQTRVARSRLVLIGERGAFHPDHARAVLAPLFLQ